MTATLLLLLIPSHVFITYAYSAVMDPDALFLTTPASMQLL